MSLQKKIVVLFLVLGAVFSLGSYSGLTAFVFPAFEDFERQSATQNVSRVRRALNAELHALDVINREYSEWDQAYDFALGHRDSYVAENLEISYWTNIDINAMMYFDLEGNLLWGTMVDMSIENELSIDEELLQPLTSEHPLLHHRAEPGVTLGILQARTAPLLVSSHPILTSSAGGPPAGTLFIGKFLDPALVVDLGERAGVTAALYPIDALQNENTETWSYTRDMITGRQVIYDVFGAPAFVLEVDTPRTITSIGRNTINTALVFFVCATVLFLLGAWLFTRGLIVAPLSKLTEHMSRIRKTGNLDQSTRSNRADEIGRLGREFSDLAKSLHAAQRDLESARDQALAISNAKSDFLAKMSHEIRTPMNGVLGMIELLSTTPLAGTQKRYMHSIKESADNLLEIISDILDFSKIEAGKLSLETRVFSLNKFVTDVTDSMSGLADQKGLRLNCILPEGPPIIVEGDPVRLRQILTNLIGNAVKFTEKGRVLLRVSSSSNFGEFEDIKFEVIDTGIGIEPRKQRQIFESFAQEDGTTTRRYGGTGLGLTISKQLVEMMGSDIQLKSEPGNGSIFSFTLRLDTAPDNELAGSGQTFAHVFGDLESGISTFKPLRGRVLVAEDNAVNQAVAVGMLDAMGVESVVANDGDKAVELFLSQPFDAILMDCQMPGLDGYQAAAKIRDIESERGDEPIRIIAVTANALTGDMEKCIAAGMDDYLRKPFKGEQLNEALVRVLQTGERPEPAAAQTGILDSIAIRTSDPALDVIDDSVLESLVALPQSSDLDLVNQVIQTYIKSSLDLMTRLGEAIDRSDSECIRTAAHSLKSSSANVGATKMAELCASIETSTRKSDKASAATLQRQLQEEYLRVIDALNRRMAAAA